MLVGDGGRLYLKPQIFLFGLRLLQPLGIILMAVIVFFQLIIASSKFFMHIGN